MWNKLSALSEWQSGIRWLFKIVLRWKFLLIFLFVLLTVFLLHLGWRKWLLSVPLPLPQASMLGSGQKDSLLRGSYYEVSIPPTETDKYISANYRLWIPNGVEPLRGLIVKQHRCNNDETPEMGLFHANDLQWQTLALKHQFALLSPKFPTGYRAGFNTQGDPCDSWDTIDSGSEKALFKALRELANNSRHPELELLPWVLWGHSGGADWAIEMSKKYSDRTIAVVAMRCGVSSLLNDRIDSGMLGIPILLAAGEKDPYADECRDQPNKIFSRYRKAGAPWTYALEADAGHEAADTRHLAIPFLDAILSVRLTKTASKGLPIDQSQGWLGNLSTKAIAPTNQYKGDPLEAVWLPNQETAHKWQEYSSTPNFWNQIRLKFCSRQKLDAFLGAPHLIESCYPEKITPMQSPASPIDLRVTKITTNEVILTWNFIPDLENGLPKFRIYRNNSLIATLQGQGYDGGDEPKPPQVFLEYRDREWTANAVYTIAAFNALGESVSQPAS